MFNVTIAAFVSKFCLLISEGCWYTNMLGNYTKSMQKTLKMNDLYKSWI